MDREIELAIDVLMERFGPNFEMVWQMLLKQVYVTMAGWGILITVVVFGWIFLGALVRRDADEGFVFFYGVVLVFMSGVALFGVHYIIGATINTEYYALRLLIQR